MSCCKVFNECVNSDDIVLEDDEYSIPSYQDYNTDIVIFFCPFCGKKLPNRKED